MIYWCKISKGVYFCLDYLKIQRLLFHFFIFNYVDSNQNLNIQQDRMNTQRKEHFILSRSVMVGNRGGGTRV